MNADTLHQIITTTATTTSLKSQIVSAMTVMEWLLMFLGWIMYWLKSLATLRKETKQFGAVTVKDFFFQNIFEIPLSAISLFVIALLASDIPPDLIDMHGKISVFIVGYSGGSIITSLTSFYKPAKTTQDKASPQTPDK